MTLWSHLWSGSWLLCKVFSLTNPCDLCPTQARPGHRGIVKFRVNKMTINHKYLLCEQRFTLCNLKPLKSNYHRENCCEVRLVSHAIMIYSPWDTTPDILRLWPMSPSNVSVFKKWKKGDSLRPVFQANCNPVCRISPLLAQQHPFPPTFTHTHTLSLTHSLSRPRPEPNGTIGPAARTLLSPRRFLKFVPPQQYNLPPPQKKSEDIF